MSIENIDEIICVEGYGEKVHLAVGSNRLTLCGFEFSGRISDKHWNEDSKKQCKRCVRQLQKWIDTK